jgi:hypothetical protein
MSTGGNGGNPASSPDRNLTSHLDLWVSVDLFVALIVPTLELIFAGHQLVGSPVARLIAVLLGTER